ncbi:MAG TPA: deoxyribodipyrimidine photo-lyase [Actinocrinis sp.]|nr:deoxyribodipyrimidine photo-lyase [Actinocrinis sp.]
MTALLWFRRDLRLADHPALDAAVRAHEQVIPVFCFDDRLLAGRHASGPRTQFLLESLHDLDRGLRDRGARLVVRRQRPEEGLVELAREAGADEVYFSRDMTPFARSRGKSVHGALEAAGIAERAFPGLTVADDVTGVRTKSGGGPYSVFSPFYKRWLDLPRRAVLAAPDEMSMPSGFTGKGRGSIPSLEELGLRQEVTDPQPGGETEAAARLAWFLDGPVHEYADLHDVPGVDGTSKLSAYLHFGCLSPRAIEAALAKGGGGNEVGGSEGAAAFHRQLCWRDFYHHVQYHYPETARTEFQERYRGGRLAWVTDEGRLSAWQQGKTGYPLVDAAMRQLLREGWMHNRARLLAGSFLTKHLGIDWREGENWFMRMLLDGDQANNNGNWQWIASVGVDPQPVFRRLYNPALHQKRYDPDGKYVCEYVPELRGVPEKYLTEPWTMPEAVQREAGCVIGKDYPKPIVDLPAAREAALARYADAAG